MSHIGVWEILLVLAIALLLFGATKLPHMAQSLGRSLTSFKKGLRETAEDVKEAVKEDVPVESEPEAMTDSTSIDNTVDTGKTE